MKVIQASVHRSGNVRCWYQTAEGERVYATLTDQAMTAGMLEALGEAVESALKAQGALPGRNALQGRPAP